MSENAFERQQVLDHARREFERMLLSMHMTRVFYEASEGVRIAKSNAGAGHQFWRKKGEGWADAVFKDVMSSDLVTRR
jgi:hypothetical protein